MRTKRDDWITAGNGDIRSFQYFQCPITGREIALLSLKYSANLKLNRVNAIAVISGIVSVSFSVQKWPWWSLFKKAQPRSEHHHEDLRWGESFSPLLSDIHEIRAISEAFVIIWSTS